MKYQSGFGNTFSTEALKGALPVGRNSPQRPAKGLYAEVISGTAFTAPRAENRSVWTYRLRPSAMHPPFKRAGNGLLRSGPFAEADVPFNRLRWNPFPLPSKPADFLDGLATVAGSGSPESQSGIAVHVYGANRSMKDRVFMNADGEMMLVPQQGGLSLFTELGLLSVEPGEIALIPRGIKFRVDLRDKARGYVCENYGAPFRLPELGPIGSQGLAQVRDFLYPVAAFEDKRKKHQLIVKFQGTLWSTQLLHSPLDVVAWHGNYAPCKYDLARFMVLGSTLFDHHDPSLFTVLTSPSGQAGVANCDFVIFPPRWLVMEDTFRPPWFHRNLMSELMGLVRGVYDGKAEGFLPGGISLHNAHSAHGPDFATWKKASAEKLQPRKIEETLAFMWESRWVFRPTAFAMKSKGLQPDYDAAWQGFPRGNKR